MKEANTQEWRQALTTHAEGIRIEEQIGRSADWFQVLAWATGAGAFGGLWSALDWIKGRNGSATIKISYTSENDEAIEVEYSNLSKDHASDVLKAHPPKLDRPTRVLICDNRNIQ